MYCRISKDKNGREEAVQLQEEWGRAYAAQTWPGEPIKVFADNNLSGNDESRPGYLALCRAIERGEVAHLWAVEQSRFARNEQMWFGLEGRLIAAGVKEVHTGRTGVIQCGSVVGGILAVVYAAERRTMLQRLNENLEAKAADGRPTGSKPFGYKHGVNARGDRTYVVIPEQAAAIRFAAEKILTGWSLSNVAAELRRRGFVGARLRNKQPTPITHQTVKSMVTNHAVAGLRVRKGQVYQGAWEPILDMVTWEAVRSKLGAPRVVTRADGRAFTHTSLRRPGATARKYLLTGGLAVCGVCGAPLCAQVKRPRAGVPGKPYYQCMPNTTTGGRGCVGILAEPLEQYVVDYFLGLLNDPAFVKGLTGDEDAARRDKLVAALAALDEERNEMSTMVGTDGYTPAMFRNFLRRLSEREQRLRAELASVPVPVSIFDPARITEAWSELELGEKREALRMVIRRVTVHRARLRPSGRVGSFDPGRVTID